ncbi:MAG TPA: hypothetical protein VF533_01470 [Solirubrobacteraceae bacterium]|jgi:hypothetical protein
MPQLVVSGLPAPIEVRRSTLNPQDVASDVRVRYRTLTDADERVLAARRSR